MTGVIICFSSHIQALVTNSKYLIASGISPLHLNKIFTNSEHVKMKSTEVVHSEMTTGYIMSSNYTCTIQQIFYQITKEQRIEQWLNES